GQLPTKKPSSGWPFGITLLAKQYIPFWVDLGVVAVFSLAIYYLAARLAMPSEFVREADVAIDSEVQVADLLAEAPTGTA
ncbi:MAG: hypothetical protein JO262_14655, partial [Solirubrobacterales bacterium]|nr:hypothetical protein [Solirubrobacterales bacterium]